MKCIYMFYIILVIILLKCDFEGFIIHNVFIMLYFEMFDELIMLGDLI